MRSFLTGILGVLLLAAACTSPKVETVASSDFSKIITAGGTVTEIVYELGFGDQIIATDRTSTYPESMQALPSIGYRNQIKAEGILSLAPSVVLIEKDYLNAEVVTQLQSAGVEVHLYNKTSSPAETKVLVAELAALFGVDDKGAEINAAIDRDMEGLSIFLKENPSAPTAAFVMARGPETVFLGGEKTFASAMFQLAGIQSAAVGFDDFVPLTPESLVSINPDYLVFFDSGIQSLGGPQGMASVVGIKETTAFQNGNLVALDGLYLSGFGPRVGKAALELAKAVRK